MEMEKYKKIKKAEIHLHLDGSLRTGTIIELADKYNIKLFSKEKDELEKYLIVGNNDTSLLDYLKKFEIPLKIMQTKESMERTAYELAEDLFNEGYIYFEVRFAPHLHTEKGIKLNEIVESVIKGINKAKEKYGIECGVILCIMRHMEVKYAEELLEISKLYKTGLDLAGDESNYPVEIFTEVFKKAYQQNIPYTIHAGEADGAESVRKVIDLKANRIGHGVRSVEDRELIDRIVKENILLEICPISNFQTKVFKNINDYPIKYLLDRGVKISINTDNRKVSNTNLYKEICFLQENYGIEEKEIIEMIGNSIKYGFVEESIKNKLLKEFYNG